MTSAPIKLHYFKSAALAEPLRFILHYGGMTFTDERFADDADFMRRKEQGTFPYGKVPILEIEGKTIHQTKAMIRYIAKKVGLVGKTEWDALECDIMVDTIEDLRAALSSYAYDSNESSKAEKKGPLMSTTIPYYVDKFEAHVAKNGGNFVKGQLTWADLFFAGISDYFCFMAEKNIFEGKTALNALREKVFALKGIKEYIAVRPHAYKL